MCEWECVGSCHRRRQVLKAAEQGGEDYAEHRGQQYCVQRKKGMQNIDSKCIKAKLRPIQNCKRQSRSDCITTAVDTSTSLHFSPCYTVATQQRENSDFTDFTNYCHPSFLCCSKSQLTSPSLFPLVLFCPPCIIPILLCFCLLLQR